MLPDWHIVFIIECALHNTRKLSAAKLPETASLTLPLEQGENVALLHGALDIADNAALLVVNEFDTDLSHVAGAASAAELPAELMREGKLTRNQKPQNNSWQCQSKRDRENEQAK